MTELDQIITLWAEATKPLWERATQLRYYGPPLTAMEPSGTASGHPIHFVDAPDGHAVASDSLVWSWWADDSSPLAALDITCKIPDDSSTSHELLVLPKLQWDLVKFGGEAAACPITLHHRHIAARVITRGGTGTLTADDSSQTLDECISILYVLPIGELQGNAPSAEPFANELLGIAWELRTTKATEISTPTGKILAALMDTSLCIFNGEAPHELAATLTAERRKTTRMIGCGADVESRFREQVAREMTVTTRPDGMVIAPNRIAAAREMAQCPWGTHDALHWLSSPSELVVSERNDSVILAKHFLQTEGGPACTLFNSRPFIFGMGYADSGARDGSGI